MIYNNILIIIISLITMLMLHLIIKITLHIILYTYIGGLIFDIIGLTLIFSKLIAIIITIFIMIDTFIIFLELEPINKISYIKFFI
ncbi:ORF MSV131 hypothetical protein [Melanoplus sanguinipes entomopoxvirus]|uniref:Uncharacterized protein n=1 Tax=Melanoplus sanguinipes entomopoxvirus TaxID=83191 RepID=Q9YVW1_MSEPV|nr:ORF MSV131 hypothetical protein [Melanoplus sanguinipes entomopoxvirus]AAC97793.1 ORF MSV131 hypothetical protein [Melanoplus sanguinipes entomopoxvirus 'O']